MVDPFIAADTTGRRAGTATGLAGDRFRDFVEIASEWCWETGPDHRFTYVGPGIGKLGWDPQALLGKRRVDLANAADRPTARWQRHLAVLDLHEGSHDFVYAM